MRALGLPDVPGTVAQGTVAVAVDVSMVEGHLRTEYLTACRLQDPARHHHLVVTVTEEGEPHMASVLDAPPPVERPPIHRLVTL